MTAFPDYHTGTVTIVAGSTIAQFVGSTLNTTNTVSGDTLVVAGHEITLWDINPGVLQATIDPWPYATIAGVTFRIKQDSPKRYVGYDAMALTIQMLGYLNALGPIINVPTGTVPDPSIGSDGMYAHRMVDDVWWTKTAGAWILSGSPSGAASLSASPQVFIGNNTFSGTFGIGTFAANRSLSMNGDIIISHPITPTPDNHPSTNITLGYGAGVAIAPIHSTQYLTLVGFEAGSQITTSDHITAIGAWAAASWTNVGSAAITAIGIDSQRNLTSGGANTTVGEHSAASLISGARVNAFGTGSQYFLTGGSDNCSFGSNSMQGVAGGTFTGSYNVAIGNYSLLNIGSASQANVSIGFQALASLTTGSFNTTVGYQAGTSLISGNYNVCIGYAGVSGLTTGNDNILIGTVNHPATTPTSGTSNYLNIGSTIYATGMGGTLKVGIGTATPACMLDVGGDFAVNANKFTVNSTSGDISAAGSANIGSGGVGATVAVVNIFGGSASGGGARLSFYKNTTPTWWLNHTSSISGVSSDLLLYNLAVGPALTFSYADNGIVVGTATGGSKGFGTINASAVYDDNVLLTCMALEYMNEGKINLDYWDSTVPDSIVPALITPSRIEQIPVMEDVEVVEMTLDRIDGGYVQREETKIISQQVVDLIPVFDKDGNGVDAIKEPVFDTKEIPEQITRNEVIEPRRHELAHLFNTMIDDGFNPCDPIAYISKMKKDQALPGMPTKDEWEHGSHSVGEIHNRLWLATELLAMTVVGLSERIDTLEKRVNA